MLFPLKIMANEKILIVDDDDSLREIIAAAITMEGMKAEQATSGKQALLAVKKNHYDLVLLDLMLGDTDGFDILKEIRNDYPYIPVLILSARKESYNKVLGLGIGADDYVTKPFCNEELIARIKAIIRRTRALTNDAAKKTRVQYLEQDCLKLDLYSYKLVKRDSVIKLSGRNFRLLKLFMENPGRVFTKEQIYKNAWDDNYFDENTLMVYISKLRKDIEDDPENPYFIKTVWGIGYKFLDE
jgi:DNA-binding response OmpR family regulator